MTAIVFFGKILLPVWTLLDQHSPHGSPRLAGGLDKNRKPPGTSVTITEVDARSLGQGCKKEGGEAQIPTPTPNPDPELVSGPDPCHLYSCPKIRLLSGLALVSLSSSAFPCRGTRDRTLSPLLRVCLWQLVRRSKQGVRWKL